MFYNFYWFYLLEMMTREKKGIKIGRQNSLSIQVFQSNRILFFYVITNYLESEQILVGYIRPVASGSLQSS
jgi:hypothetical protein